MVMCTAIKCTEIHSSMHLCQSYIGRKTAVFSTIPRRLEHCAWTRGLAIGPHKGSVRVYTSTSQRSFMDLLLLDFITNWRTIRGRGFTFSFYIFIFKDVHIFLFPFYLPLGPVLCVCVSVCIAIGHFERKRIGVSWPSLGDSAAYMHI